MPQVLTVVCKLEVATGQTEPLNGVLAAFAQGCEFVHANTPTNLTNKLAVQKPGASEAMSCSLQDVVLRATESRLSIA